MTNLRNNARMTYTVVSPHEANLLEGKISIKSPVAQAANSMATSIRSKYIFCFITFLFFNVDYWINNFVSKWGYSARH